MHTEIEAKFLDIDPSSFREKMAATGARMIFPERAMRRKNFDFPDRRLDKDGGWIRVRDEGAGTATLAYKKFIEHSATGMQEIETEAKEFDAVCEILLAIGLTMKSYQETRREKWMLSDVEIVIDTWPWIPTFIEVEALSEVALHKAVATLGLDWSKALHGGVAGAYMHYFDVTHEEVNSWESVAFMPIPEWLERKRKG